MLLPVPNLLVVPHTFRKACRDPHDLALTHLPFHSAYVSFVILAVFFQPLLSILCISILSQILPSWLFSGLPPWHHVTPFSFIQHVCHSFFCLLVFCLLAPRVQDLHEQRTLLSYSLLYPSGVSAGKESACQCRRRRRRGFDPWVRNIPLRRKWQPTPVFLPGEPHEQRSLVGYHPWGHKESDTTEHARSSSWLCFDRLHNWKTTIII